jgi:hypothetical protein
MNGNDAVALLLYHAYPYALAWNSSRAFRVAVRANSVQLIAEFAGDANVQVAQVPPQQEAAGLNGSAVDIAIGKDYGDALEAMLPKLQAVSVPRTVQMLNDALTRKAMNAIRFLAENQWHDWTEIFFEAIDQDDGRVIAWILVTRLIEMQNYAEWFESAIDRAIHKGKLLALKIMLQHRASQVGNISDYNRLINALRHGNDQAARVIARYGAITAMDLMLLDAAARQRLEGG